MAEMIKVGMLGILGVLLALQFKANKPEYGIYIGFGLALLIFSYGINQILAVLERFESLHSFLGESGQYLTVLLRVIGVTYICEFSAGICKDAGYGSVAEQIEIFGKLSVMFAGIPILFAVIEQIQGLI